MASLRFTDLFDLTPYPEPKAGQGFLCHLATIGAEGLLPLVEMVEALVLGEHEPVEGGLNARLQHRRTRRHAAEVEARTGGLDQLVSVVAPGLNPLLEAVSERWPEGFDLLEADDLAAFLTKPEAPDAAPCSVAGRETVMGSLSARLLGGVPPGPLLPGARTLIGLLESLSREDCARVIASPGRLDDLAASETSRAEAWAALGFERSPDGLADQARRAVLVLMDLAAAYEARREDDPDCETALRNATDAVLQNVSDLLVRPSTKLAARLQPIAAAAYQRVRGAGADIHDALRDELGRAGVVPWPALVDALALPEGGRSEEGGRSIKGMGGAETAAWIIVGELAGYSKNTMRKLAERVVEKPVLAFGRSPGPADRLLYACRLVSLDDADADRLYTAACAGIREEKPWFIWRNALLWTDRI